MARFYYSVLRWRDESARCGEQTSDEGGERTNERTKKKKEGRKG